MCCTNKSENLICFFFFRSTSCLCIYNKRTVRFFCVFLPLYPVGGRFFFFAYCNVACIWKESNRFKKEIEELKIKSKRTERKDIYKKKKRQWLLTRKALMPIPFITITAFWNIYVIHLWQNHLEDFDFFVIYFFFCFVFTFCVWLLFSNLDFSTLTLLLSRSESHSDHIEGSIMKNSQNFLIFLHIYLFCCCTFLSLIEIEFHLSVTLVLSQFKQKNGEKQKFWFVVYESRKNSAF